MILKEKLIILNRGGGQAQPINLENQENQSPSHPAAVAPILSHSGVLPTATIWVLPSGISNVIGIETKFWNTRTWG